MQLTVRFISVQTIRTAPMFFYHLQMRIIQFTTKLRIERLEDEIRRVRMMRGHIGWTLLTNMILSVLTAEVIQEFDVFR